MYKKVQLMIHKLASVWPVIHFQHAHASYIQEQLLIPYQIFSHLLTTFFKAIWNSSLGLIPQDQCKTHSEYSLVATLTAQLT